MDYSAEFIRLRSAAKKIYFTQTKEETFHVIENIAQPFEFHQEETMVYQYYYLVFGIILF